MSNGYARSHRIADAGLVLLAAGSLSLMGTHGAAPGGNVVLAMVALLMLARDRPSLRAQALLVTRAGSTLALVGFGLSLDRYSNGSGEVWGDSMAAWLAAACTSGVATWRLTIRESIAPALASTERHQELLEAIERAGRTGTTSVPGARAANMH